MKEINQDRGIINPNAANLQPGPAVPLSAYVAGQVQNPELPVGANLTPVTQKVQTNELMTGTGTVLSPTGTAITSPMPIAAPMSVTPQPIVAATTAPVQMIQGQQGVAQVVNPTDVTNLLNQQAGQMQATYTNAVAPMQAQQGTVSNQATVQGQLDKLMNFDPNNVPAWMQGTINAVNEATAGRGLGYSTIAKTALAQAVLQQALPIAAQDASTFFQMDMTNLNNRQQTAMQNVQMQQQNMLTDTSIANASAQFNAANAQQTEQFTASLVANIREQNASRVTALSQFNAAEANKISAQNVQNIIGTEQFNAASINQAAQLSATQSLQAQEFNVQQKVAVDQFNSQQDAAIKQFNAQLQSQRESFNAQNQFAIEQSNVLWRRGVNTANTAAINAANQSNVQNKFNMSQVAQNNLWQMWRDEASQSFTATENQIARDYNMAMAANNRDFNSRNDPQQPSLMGQLGAFASLLSV